MTEPMEFIMSSVKFVVTEPIDPASKDHVYTLEKARLTGADMDGDIVDGKYVHVLKNIVRDIHVKK